MQAAFLLVPPGSWFTLCQSLHSSQEFGGVATVNTRLVPALAASAMMTNPTLRRAITEGVALARTGKGISGSSR